MEVILVSFNKIIPIFINKWRFTYVNILLAENDTHSTDLTPNGMNESVTKVIGKFHWYSAVRFKCKSVYFHAILLFSDNSTHAADEKLNTESASTTVPPMQDIESAKNNPCIYTENGYKCCRNFHVSLVHSSQTGNIVYQEWIIIYNTYFILHTRIFPTIGVQYTLEGCAILEYLQKNKLSMQLNIGKEFSNNTVTVRGIFLQDFWLHCYTTKVY